MARDPCAPAWLRRSGPDGHAAADHDDCSRRHGDAFSDCHRLSDSGPVDAASHRTDATGAATHVAAVTHSDRIVRPAATDRSSSRTNAPDAGCVPCAVTWDQALNYIGQEITIIGPVMSTAWASDSRGKPTFLNIGRSYPDPERFTVLLWIDARFRFDEPPEQTYADKTICVTGIVEIYEGSGEIVVDYPWQIVVP
ncbi:MAG: hypothetical protein M9890_04315 [Thermomicrobiales bacterium]|nr:hypothetical protein [Thermomicrobiales bacterium]